MRFTFVASLLAVAAMSSIASPSAHANLLINGDFENQPNFGINGDGSFTLLTGSQLPGWTIADNHGVTIHNHGYPTISGTYSVNLDGEGANGNNADFSQTVNTISGTTYQLDFDYATWVPAAGVMHVELSTLFGTFYSGSFVVPSELTHRSTTFVTSGQPVTLRVYETGSGVNDNAFIVDNFAINAIPEPTGLAALALPALVALIRRRRL